MKCRECGFEDKNAAFARCPRCGTPVAPCSQLLAEALAKKDERYSHKPVRNVTKK